MCLVYHLLTLLAFPLHLYRKPPFQKNKKTSADDEMEWKHDKFEELMRDDDQRRDSRYPRDAGRGGNSDRQQGNRDSHRDRSEHHYSHQRSEQDRSDANRNYRDNREYRDSKPSGNARGRVVAPQSPEQLAKPAAEPPRQPAQKSAHRSEGQEQQQQQHRPPVPSSIPAHVPASTRPVTQSSSHPPPSVSHQGGDRGQEGRLAVMAPSIIT
ncbi:hypothetical protein EON65_10040, partial [archaeon]